MRLIKKRKTLYQLVQGLADPMAGEAAVVEVEVLGDEADDEDERVDAHGQLLVEELRGGVTEGQAGKSTNVISSSNESSGRSGISPPLTTAFITSLMRETSNGMTTGKMLGGAGGGRVEIRRPIVSVMYASFLERQGKRITKEG